MPTYAPSSMRRPPEADKGAEEAVKLEEEAAFEKCVGLLRGLETPAVLLHTRRGFPAPLTLRELEALSAAVPDHSPAPLALQVSAAELLDEPGAAVLRQECSIWAPS